MSVDSLISIEPVHTHCMHARIQNILSEGVVRVDRNATKNGPPSAHQHLVLPRVAIVQSCRKVDTTKPSLVKMAHQRNAFEMAFCWRVNGPPLNAGLVAL